MPKRLAEYWNFAGTAGRRALLANFVRSPFFREDGARRYWTSVPRLSNNRKKQPHRQYHTRWWRQRKRTCRRVARCSLADEPSTPVLSVPRATHAGRKRRKVHTPQYQSGFHCRCNTKLWFPHWFFGRYFKQSLTCLTLGADVEPSGHLRFHGSPDTHADLIDPSLLLGHPQNISPTRMLSAYPCRQSCHPSGASLLSDSVPTIQQRGITPLVVTMLDLSRRRERTECPVRVPGYHGNCHS